MVASVSPVMSTATETAGFTTFATAIGECGIAWGERGLLGIALPGDAARLHRRFGHDEQAPGAAPDPVREVVTGIKELLAGAAVDLSHAELDLTGISDFDRAVSAVALTIPAGGTLTYGEISARVGSPNDARDVGQALGRNRFPLVVPCHRVISADGGLGGFSAAGGTATKRRLLEIERPHAQGPPTLF
jgi:methylated-DNA-[protein]-cysteine S-methyltransferase